MNRAATEAEAIVDVEMEASRVLLAGLKFAPMTEAQVIDHVTAEAGSRRGGWLVNPNVDVLRIASERRELRKLVSDADLVVADGMPLVWASHIQGTPLPERVAGSTLIVTLTAKAREKGLKVLLLGGRPEAGRRAAEVLRDGHPDFKIECYCPVMGFEDDAMQMDDLHKFMREFDPAICYCAFGFPKQELLMYELHRRFPECWFIGSGASIDFVGGAQQRAPVLMQRLGVEWVFRLAQEPRRLAGRYLWHGIPFAVRLLAASLFSRGARATVARRRERIDLTH